MTTFRIVFETTHLEQSKKLLKDIMEQYSDSKFVEKLTWEIVGMSEDPIK